MYEYHGIEVFAIFIDISQLYTVNSRYSGHPRDRDLVSIIARVRNSGVRENFYYSSTFFRPGVASKERQNFIYKHNRT